jgi:hypothetical protein
VRSSTPRTKLVPMKPAPPVTKSFTCQVLIGQ